MKAFGQKLGVPQATGPPRGADEIGRLTRI
jgi:hypothetical protein